MKLEQFLPAEDLRRSPISGEVVGALVAIQHASRSALAAVVKSVGVEVNIPPSQKQTIVFREAVMAKRKENNRQAVIDNNVVLNGNHIYMEGAEPAAEFKHLPEPHSIPWTKEQKKALMDTAFKPIKHHGIGAEAGLAIIEQMKKNPQSGRDMLGASQARSQSRGRSLERIRD